MPEIVYYVAASLDGFIATEEAMRSRSGPGPSASRRRQPAGFAASTISRAAPRSEYQTASIWV